MQYYFLPYLLVKLLKYPYKPRPINTNYWRDTGRLIIYYKMVLFVYKQRIKSEIV